MLDLIKMIDANLNYQGELNVNSLIKAIGSNLQELERVCQAFGVPYSSNNQIDKKEMASHIANRFNENRSMRNEVFQQIEEFLQEKRYEEAELLACKNIGAIKYNQLISLSQRYLKKHIIQVLDESNIKELIERGDFKSADEMARSSLKGELLQEQYRSIRKRIADTKADQMTQRFDALVLENKLDAAYEQAEDLMAFLSKYDDRRLALFLKRYNAMRKESEEKYYLETVEKVKHNLQIHNFDEANRIYLKNETLLKSLNYEQLRDAAMRQYNNKKANELREEIITLLENSSFKQADKVYYQNEQLLKDFNYEKVKSKELEKYNNQIKAEAIRRINELLNQQRFDEAHKKYELCKSFLGEFDFIKQKNDVIENLKEVQRKEIKHTIRELILKNKIDEANRLYDENRALLDKGDFHKDKEIFFNEVKKGKIKMIKREIMALISDHQFNEAHQLYLQNTGVVDQHEYWKTRNEAYQRYKSNIQKLYEDALTSGNFIKAERLFNAPELSISKQLHQNNLRKYRAQIVSSIVLESRKRVLIVDSARPYNPSSVMGVVNKRRIKHLLHFTKADNLLSILQNGLVPVRLQSVLGVTSNNNDYMRYDQIDTATSLSVDFPNYKVFYSFRSKLYPDDVWVMIKLKPTVLVSKENKAYYCQTNAANRTDRKMGHTHEAFESMFATTIMTKEGIIVQRENLSIPDNWTTDPQAEVLVDGIIDPSYIDSVVFERKAHFESLVQKERQSIINDHKIEISSELFNYRQDYQFWKSSSKENQYG